MQRAKESYPSKRIALFSCFTPEFLIMSSQEERMTMNCKLFTIIVTGSFVFVGTFAQGNPTMLPNHPGYPMGAAKDPVTGQSVANDPGQSPPSQEDSLQQAGSFHDSHSVNPGREERANIVPPGASKSMDAQDPSTRKSMDTPTGSPPSR